MKRSDPPLVSTRCFHLLPFTTVSWKSVSVASGERGVRRAWRPSSAAWIQRSRPDMQVANDVANLLLLDPLGLMWCSGQRFPFAIFSFFVWHYGKAWRDKRAGNQGERGKLTNCSTFFCLSSFFSSFSSWSQWSFILCFSWLSSSGTVLSSVSGASSLPQSPGRPQHHALTV